jgi:glutamine synthetase
LVCYDNSKNVALFKKFHILNEKEIKARQQILFGEYCAHVKIESLTMLDMINRQIIPAVIKYQSKLAKLICDKKPLKVKADVENNLLNEINHLFIKINDAKNKLLDDLVELRKVALINLRAKYYDEIIRDDTNVLRAIVDQMERLIPKEI